MILRLLLSVLLLFAVGSAEAQRQRGADRPARGAKPEAEMPPEVEPVQDGPQLDAIERMLQEDEAVLEGDGFSYDPGDRRDPFLSLLSVADEPALFGPRPEGVPGLMIEEVSVTGVFVTPNGPVAQVQTADKTKSYLLRQGDELYDGDVLSIRFTRNEGAEVVFRQEVRDPTAPRPFREVVKKLNP